MLPFLPAMLALTQDDSPMLLYLMVGGCIALGPALYSWIMVWQFFKGDRPDMSRYVTQEQLAIIKADRDKQIVETLTAIRNDVAAMKQEVKDDLERFESTADDLKKDMMSLHRSLGRVEGHDEAETRRRPR